MSEQNSKQASSLSVSQFKLWPQNVYKYTFFCGYLLRYNTSRVHCFAWYKRRIMIIDDLYLQPRHGFVLNQETPHHVTTPFKTKCPCLAQAEKTIFRAIFASYFELLIIAIMRCSIVMISTRPLWVLTLHQAQVANYLSPLPVITMAIVGQSSVKAYNQIAITAQLFRNNVS